MTIFVFHNGPKLEIPSWGVYSLSTIEVYAKHCDVVRSRTSALFNICSRVDSPVRTVIVFVTLHTAVPGELGICPLLTTRDPPRGPTAFSKDGSLSLTLSIYLSLSICLFLSLPFSFTSLPLSFDIGVFSD